MKKFALTLFAQLFLTTCFAQDSYFANYKSTRLYNNPAFCGFAQYPEININHRSQWPELESSYQTTYIGYDKEFEHKNSSFGIYGLLDNVGALSKRDLMLQYAYNFSFKKDLYIKPGISLGFGQSYVDFTQLIFGSQINPVTGTIDTIPYENYSSFNFDASVGLLFNYKNLYVAPSIFHINSMKIFQENDSFRIKVPKLNIFVSFVFQLNDKLAIIPSIDFKTQSSFKIFLARCDLQINKFAIGARYSHLSVGSELFGASIGYTFKRFGFFYTYEFYTSDLVDGNLLSHEAGIFIKPSLKNKTNTSLGLGLF